MPFAVPRAVLALGCALSIATLAQAAPSAPSSLRETPKPDAKPDELFHSLVPKLHLEFSPQALQDLRFAPRVYTQVTVREGTTVYTNVGVKVKGGRGSLRPIDTRPGLTLNFDKFQPGQKFHGVDKIHLNNGVQDVTLMNEMLGGSVFRAAGLPAARSTHARVFLNADDMGLYILKESFDQHFLKRYFTRPEGNLYDSGLLADITAPLEKDSGSGSDDHSDLQKLYTAALEPNLARRKERLTNILDLDRFITFAALERLIGHWDGYTGNHNNYRLYFDPAASRFLFFVHGMDLLFQPSTFPILPGQPSTEPTSGRGGRAGRGGRGGILTAAVFDIPEYRELYLKRVGELLDTHFTVAHLHAEVDRIVTRLQSQLTGSDLAVAATVTSQASAVKLKLASRIEGARIQHTQLAPPTRTNATPAGRP